MPTIIKEFAPGERIQEHTIELLNPSKVLNVEVNSGNVTYELVKNKLHLKFTNGKDYEMALISGEYVPESNKVITGHDSPTYVDDEGYYGRLSKYLYSGRYLPKDTQYVSGYHQMHYKDDNGYEGFLEEYLYSGFIIFGKSKYIKNYHKKYYEDDDNYSGELIESEEYDPEKDKYVKVYSGLVSQPNQDNRIWRFKGNVYRDEIDTRVYKYKGVAKKPAKDTRVWEQKYKYKVTIKYLTKDDTNKHLKRLESSNKNIYNIVSDKVISVYNLPKEAPKGSIYYCNSDKKLYYYSNEWKEIKTKELGG